MCNDLQVEILSNKLPRKKKVLKYKIESYKQNMLLLWYIF